MIPLSKEGITSFMVKKVFIVSVLLLALIVYMHMKVPAQQGVKPFLEFPVKGYTPYTAPISSVFDHSMTTGRYSADGIVIAYTGEKGSKGRDDDCKEGDGEKFIVNGSYTGTQKSTSKKLCYEGHPGIDFRFKKGTEIYAAADGEVIAVSINCKEGDRECGGRWGNYVKIRHPNGYLTAYLHLLEDSIPERFHNASIHNPIRVFKGELIGKVGNTGYSFGPHLHFEVQNSDNISVDPYGWLGPFPDPYTRAKNVNLWVNGQQGILIKSSNRLEVYWLQNGKRYWVMNPTVMEKMCSNPKDPNECIPGWGSHRIIEFPEETIQNIPEGPNFILLPNLADDSIKPSCPPEEGNACSNGLLIRQREDTKVYVIQDGQRRWIPSAQIFMEQGFDWNDVIEVTPAIMQMIPEGPPLGSEVVRSQGFEPGWNLFSVPFVSINVQDLCDDLVPCNPVWHWDPMQGKYQKANDLQRGKGYFVYVESSSYLQVQGILVNDPEYKIRLYNGWNMVGQPYDYAVRLADFLFQASESESPIPIGQAIAGGLIRLYLFQQTNTFVWYDVNVFTGEVYRTAWDPDAKKYSPWEKTFISADQVTLNAWQGMFVKAQGGWLIVPNRPADMPFELPSFRAPVTWNPDRRTFPSPNLLPPPPGDGEGPTSPSVSNVTPTTLTLGDQASVTLMGTGLTQVTGLDFGPGVQVLDFTVVSDTQIDVTVSVEPTASPGPRDITLITSNGTFTFSGWITVEAPPWPQDLVVFREMGRCILTPRGGMALKMIMLRNERGGTGTVTVTDIRPVGAGWQDFQLMRGLGPLGDGRLAVIMARGTCTSNDLAVEIVLDSGGVWSAQAEAERESIPSPPSFGPNRSRKPKVAVQTRAEGSLITVTVQAPAPTARTRIALHLYDLGGRPVAATESNGRRLLLGAWDRQGHPLANGVYLALVTVTIHGPQTDTEATVRQVRKVVVLRQR